jgi:hypothetical protein
MKLVYIHSHIVGPHTFTNLFMLSLSVWSDSPVTPKLALSSTALVIFCLGNVWSDFYQFGVQFQVENLKLKTQIT